MCIVTITLTISFIVIVTNLTATDLVDHLDVSGESGVVPGQLCQLLLHAGHHVSAADALVVYVFDFVVGDFVVGDLVVAVIIVVVAAVVHCGHHVAAAQHTHAVTEG